MSSTTDSMPIAAQLAKVWLDIDVLMVPTAPTHPTVDSVLADPVGRNALLGTYTNFVNLLGLSALAMPAGLTSEDMPFGVTFIAPAGHDVALLHLGTAWQQAEAAFALTGQAIVAFVTLEGNYEGDAEMEAACRIAQLHDTVAALPAAAAHSRADRRHGSGSAWPRRCRARC